MPSKMVKAAANDMMQKFVDYNEAFLLMGDKNEKLEGQSLIFCIFFSTKTGDMVALRKENFKMKGRIFELEKEQRELVEGAMLIKTDGF